MKKYRLLKDMIFPTFYIPEGTIGYETKSKSGYIFKARTGIDQTFAEQFLTDNPTWFEIAEEKWTDDEMKDFAEYVKDTDNPEGRISYDSLLLHWQWSLFDYGFRKHLPQLNSES